MTLKDATKKKLDRFGPYGSAIGACIGSITFMLYCIEVPPFSTIMMNIWISFFLSPPFLAYVLSTCTHRKYIIYSPGALGGAIGALVGFYLGGYVHFFGMRTPAEERIPLFVIHGIIIIVCTFLLSRYMCRRAQRKLTKGVR